MRKPDFFVNSLSEFVKAVDEITNLWYKAEGSFIYPWFRGHADQSFTLLPGIYRNKKLNDHEDSYRHDFMFKAHPFLDQGFSKPRNDLEWYFLMQHYKMPTRLLDWSEGSLLALHFAITDKKEDSNPCVWVLNPFEFNMRFKGDDDLLSDEKLINKYIPRMWAKNPRIPKDPIAIQPTTNSKRIHSQKGCFILFGSEKIDLSKQRNTKSFLQKIEVNIEPLEDIKDSLVVAGVTEAMVYPELDGLAREIQQYYRT